MKKQLTCTKCLSAMRFDAGSPVNFCCYCGARVDMGSSYNILDKGFEKLEPFELPHDIGRLGKLNFRRVTDKDPKSKARRVDDGVPDWDQEDWYRRLKEI